MNRYFSCDDADGTVIDLEKVEMVGKQSVHLSSGNFVSVTYNDARLIKKILRSRDSEPQKVEKKHERDDLDGD